MRFPVASSRRATRQQGMAMIALITMIALLAAYLISTLLSRTSSEVLVDRSQRAQDALLTAKAALIAWAADADSGAAGYQPGSLPCPDTNNDGTAEGSCSGTNVVVGRLPWKTLNLDDLRDASGERLWYAISPRFRKISSNVINSDTRGQLTLTDTTGTASAGNIVAVVIAPGVALGGQTRGSANVNSAASYLESTNAGTTGTFTYTTTAQPSDTFNDQVVAITEADLFAAVEPVVAAVIDRDLKSDLATYYTQWTNTFPYPARFDSPDPGSNSNVSPPVTTRTQAQYIGDTSQSPGGLLPVTASAAYSWTAGSGAVTLTGGTAGGISGVSCNTISSPFSGWQCTFRIDALDVGPGYGIDPTCNFNRYCMIAPSFTVSGGVEANAGKSFAKLPNATSDVTVTSPGGSTRNMIARAISGTLTAAGVGTVTFSGTYSGNGSNDPPRYSSSSFSRSMRVRIPDLTASPLTSSTNWFISNEWYRLTYYAVSPGHLPGGGGSCTALPATPSCLTVNNMPAYYASPSTNKRAVLILAGRALNGSARPSATLGNYLESTNATPTGYIFEHRAGPPSSINDRVIVICPDSTYCP